MRKIPLSASLLTFLDDLEYTEAGLSAVDEVADLAQPFRAEIEDWPGLFAKEREGRREVTRADAIVSVANMQIDETTLRFGGEVLVESNLDRKSTFFRRFFTVAPSVFVRKGLRAQAEHTLNKIVPEVLSLDAKSRLQAYVAPLKGLAEKAIAALDKRAKAKASRATTAADIEEWKEGINQLRLTTYAELVKVAAASGHDRRWADTFFRSEEGESESEGAPGKEEAGKEEAKPEG